MRKLWEGFKNLAVFWKFKENKSHELSCILRTLKKISLDELSRDSKGDRQLTHLVAGKR